MILTIFTPTYNRASLLPRVYASILKQDTSNIEWLIVDDGSTDNTEKVVWQMFCEEKLTIRYFKKKNGGKHTAHNMAVQAAEGELFLCIDSDDLLADGAMQAITKARREMREGDCGLIGYKAQADGRELSSRLPDAKEQHMGMYGYAKSCGVGEYAVVLRTELIRRHPYPEIKSERFAGESILYDRLELDGYTLCPILATLEVCEYQPDGLTSSFFKLMLQSPGGYTLYHAQRIDLVTTVKERIRHCIQYQAFRSMSQGKAMTYYGPHKTMTELAWVPGRIAAKYYKARGKKRG